MSKSFANQPDPLLNHNLPVIFPILERLLARARTGHKEYGTLLQSFNGRCFLEDALDETLDLAKYLQGAIEERDYLHDLIGQVVKEYEAIKPMAIATLPVKMNDALKTLCAYYEQSEANNND